MASSGEDNVGPSAAPPEQHLSSGRKRDGTARSMRGPMSAPESSYENAEESKEEIGATTNAAPPKQRRMANSINKPSVVEPTFFASEGSQTLDAAPLPTAVTQSRIRGHQPTSSAVRDAGAGAGLARKKTRSGARATRPGAIPAGAAAAGAVGTTETRTSVVSASGAPTAASVVVGGETNTPSVPGAVMMTPSSEGEGAAADSAGYHSRSRAAAERRKMTSGKGGSAAADTDGAATSSSTSAQNAEASTPPATIEGPDRSASSDYHSRRAAAERRKMAAPGAAAAVGATAAGAQTDTANFAAVNLAGDGGASTPPAPGAVAITDGPDQSASSAGYQHHQSRDREAAERRKMAAVGAAGAATAVAAASQETDSANNLGRGDASVDVESGVSARTAAERRKARAAMSDDVGKHYGGRGGAAVAGGAAVGAAVAGAAALGDDQVEEPGMTDTVDRLSTVSMLGAQPGEGGRQSRDDGEHQAAGANAMVPPVATGDGGVVSQADATGAEPPPPVEQRALLGAERPQAGGGNRNEQMQEEEDELIPVAQLVDPDDDGDGLDLEQEMDEDAVAEVMQDDEVRRRILGDDIVFAVEAGEDDFHDDDENAKDRAWFRKYWKLLVVVGLCLVGGMVAVIVVVVGGDDGPSPPPAPSGISPTATPPPVVTQEPTGPTAMPTSAPTLGPTSVDFANLSPVVAMAAPSTAAALLRGGSPQHQALTWLVEEDELYPDISNDTEKLVQRFALATLFYATGGANGNWGNDFGFLSNKTECDWFENVGGSTDPIRGAQCNDDDRVNFLLFNGNGLRGTIPDEIGALTDLENLILDKNDLSGEIPTTIANLTSLIHLALKVNSNGNPGLEGNVVIGDWPKLTTLDYSTNSLTGAIPKEIGNLTELEEIFFQINKLSGELPTELGNLKKVKQLFLEDNGLSGFVPTELAEMDSLRNVWLSKNDFKGDQVKPDAGMDILCDLNLNLFYADCLVSTFPDIPKDVECECCTICCNEAEPIDCLPA